MPVTYDPVANKITAITPPTLKFKDVYDADKAGTLSLHDRNGIAAVDGAPVSTNRALRPADEKLMGGTKNDLWITIENWVNMTSATVRLIGTDEGGNALQEDIAVTGNGSYYASELFKTLTQTQTVAFSGTGSFDYELSQGQWGVSWMIAKYWSGTGASWFYAFCFDAQLEIGNGATVTTFTDACVLVMFDPSLPNPALKLKAQTTITFTDVSLLQVRQYGLILHQELGSVITMTRCWVGRGVDNIGRQSARFEGKATLKMVVFRICDLSGPAEEWHASRVSVDGGSGFIYPAGTDFDDILIQNCRYGLWQDYNAPQSATFRGLKIRSISVKTFYRGYHHTNTYVVDCDIEAWTFAWIGSAGKTYRQYSFDAHVQDKNGNPLSGVSAVGEYINPYGQAFSVTTDANGDIPTQTVDKSWYEQATGDNENLKTPLKVTYKKAGYKTLVKHYPLPEKTKDSVVLQKAIDTIFVDGKLALNLSETDPENELYAQV